MNEQIINENICLQNQDGFIKNYCKNPIILKATISCFIAITSAGVVIIAAIVASLATVPGFLIGLPFLGGIIASHVTATAVVASLPVTIGAAFGLGTGSAFAFKGKKVQIHVGESLDKVANVVGEIIFLPMLAKCKSLIERKPFDKEYENKITRNAKEQIMKWGYNEKYVNELIIKNLSKTPEDIQNDYNSIIEQLKQIDKKGKFNDVDICQLPAKAINKIAINLYKDF